MAERSKVQVVQAGTTDGGTTTIEAEEVVPTGMQPSTNPNSVPDTSDTDNIHIHRTLTSQVVSQFRNRGCTKFCNRNANNGNKSGGATFSSSSQRQRLISEVSECGEDHCPVCLNRCRIFAVGLCNHHVCSECSTRMRVLCGQNECPICRQDMPKV